MAIRWLCTIVLLGLCSRISAQVDRATLAGTVSDSSGAIVPGVTVVVTSKETGLRREAQTSAHGAYSVPGLPLGNYTVTVTHTGFRPVAVKDLQLNVGDNRTLNLELQVSTSETRLVVESTAEALETSSPVIGTVVGTQQVRELPINGRHGLV